MNIALIAHDAKKKLMQNFCIAYRGILCKNDLYATGTTGRLVEEVTNLNPYINIWPAISEACSRSAQRSNTMKSIL
jgi:methylglyoxal synthase